MRSMGRLSRSFFRDLTRREIFSHNCAHVTDIDQVNRSPCFFFFFFFSRVHTLIETSLCIHYNRVTALWIHCNREHIWSERDERKRTCGHGWMVSLLPRSKHQSVKCIEGQIDIHAEMFLLVKVCHRYCYYEKCWRLTIKRIDASSPYLSFHGNFLLQLEFLTGNQCVFFSQRSKIKSSRA